MTIYISTAHINLQQTLCMSLKHPFMNLWEERFVINQNVSQLPLCENLTSNLSQI